MSDRGEYCAPMMRELIESEKPRERLERLGADALKDGELIAILLRTGKRGRSVLAVAEELLQTFGSLEGLGKAEINELCRVPGVGKAKAIELKAAFTLAKRLSESRRQARKEISAPQHVAEAMRDVFLLLDHEEFHVLLLDRKNRLIRPQKVTQGTLDATVVDARKVFEPAITESASSVVLVHNHPSGDPTPSREDIALTKELVKAGEFLRIEVLDHVIMGRKTEGRAEDFVSLKELHLL